MNDGIGQKLKKQKIDAIVIGFFTRTCSEQLFMSKERISRQGFTKLVFTIVLQRISLERGNGSYGVSK